MVGPAGVMETEKTGLTATVTVVVAVLLRESVA
jgi:hypothetical protein